MILFWQEEFIVSSPFLNGFLIVTILVISFGASLHSVRAQEIVLSDWTSPTLSNLFSVYMVNASDGWAVGEHGTIIHWDGTQWTNVTSPTTLALFSVSMTSADNGWAVGQNGTIIRWNGIAWQNFSSPTQLNLYSVCMLNASDGWAVGHDGTVIHWNGTEWMNFPSNTNYTLYSVSMADANDGWAMGYDWIHWNGTSWKEDSDAVMIPNVNSVYMVNSNNAWAAGELGSIWHWNGTQWSLNANVSGPMYVFDSVFMTSATDGWAVGWWGTLIPQNATTVTLHWDGTQWTYVGGPLLIGLNSVYMVSSNDGWAVGAQGTIIHWTGSEWVPEFSTTNYALLMVAFTLTAILLKKVHLLKSQKPKVPTSKILNIFERHRTLCNSSVQI